MSRFFDNYSPAEKMKELIRDSAKSRKNLEERVVRDFSTEKPEKRIVKIDEAIIASVLHEDRIRGKRGRPKKNDSDKVFPTTLKLNRKRYRQIVEEMSTRIVGYKRLGLSRILNFLFDDYLKNKKRIDYQAKIIQNLCERLLQSYPINELLLKNDISVNKEFSDLISMLKITMIETKDLKGRVSKETEVIVTIAYRKMQ